MEKGKLEEDSNADAKRKRFILSTDLKLAPKKLEEASKLIAHAWVICKPFMDSYEK